MNRYYADYLLFSIPLRLKLNQKMIKILFYIWKFKSTLQGNSQVKEKIIEISIKAYLPKLTQEGIQT